MTDDPKARLLTLDVRLLCVNTTQTCELLNVSRGTWTSWVSKGYAPKKDTELGGSPVWYLSTLFEYALNAPGGRLGYPVR